MIRRSLLLAVVIMCRLAHAARSSCFFSLFLCARVDLCVVTVGLLYEFQLGCEHLRRGHWPSASWALQASSENAWLPAASHLVLQSVRSRGYYLMIGKLCFSFRDLVRDPATKYISESISRAQPD